MAIVGFNVQRTHKQMSVITNDDSSLVFAFGRVDADNDLSLDEGSLLV